MTHSTGPVRPTEVIAQRMKELRRKRGLSAARLADCMTEVGVPWDRSIVANLENGRRGSVTVTELFALAYIFNVAVVHLLTPPLPSQFVNVEDPSACRSPDDPNEPNDTTTLYQVTPEHAVPVYRVRQFIRGYRPLPGGDARLFFSEVPAHEFAHDVDQLIEAEGRYRGDS